MMQLNSVASSSNLYRFVGRLSLFSLFILRYFHCREEFRSINHLAIFENGNHLLSVACECICGSKKPNSLWGLIKRKRTGLILIIMWFLEYELISGIWCDIIVLFILYWVRYHQCGMWSKCLPTCHEIGELLSVTFSRRCKDI